VYPSDCGDPATVNLVAIPIAFVGARAPLSTWRHESFTLQWRSVALAVAATAAPSINWEGKEGVGASMS
jgi:hypothetical protein